jgi:Cys-tRNA(Pro) deacylase
MKTSIDVHNYLLSCNIPHEIVPIDTPIMTVERAVALLRLDPSEITKSVVLMADDNPLIAILPGDKRVSYEKLRDHLHASEIKLAGSQELAELTGYPIGATPPLAHSTKLKTLIDPKVLEAEVIYTGAGDVTAILKMRACDLQKITDGEIISITD